MYYLLIIGFALALPAAIALALWPSERDARNARDLAERVGAGRRTCDCQCTCSCGYDLTGRMFD